MNELTCETFDFKPGVHARLRRLLAKRHEKCGLNLDSKDED
jgi:hypothetical protein